MKHNYASFEGLFFFFNKKDRGENRCISHRNRYHSLYAFVRDAKNLRQKLCLIAATNMKHLAICFCENHTGRDGAAVL